MLPVSGYEYARAFVASCRAPQRQAAGHSWISWLFYLTVTVTVLVWAGGTLSHGRA